MEAQKLVARLPNNYKTLEMEIKRDGGGGGDWVG